MKSAKNIIEFLFLLIFYYLFKIIGLNFSSFLGGVILSFYGMFSSRNKIVEKNLKIAFPGINSNSVKKITRKMWFHFGRVVGEYPNLNKINIGKNKNIIIENEKNLILPLQKHSNCLFFSAHIGNWELTSHLLTKEGFKINFIYRAPNNKFVDNLLVKIREDYGVGLIKKGNKGAKECIKILNSSNGHIGMLIDQKMNDGITTSFFNRKVRSPSAIAKFAIKFRCPIIPAVCIREKSTNFKISYLKPITPIQIKKMGNDVKIMNYLNKYVEEWVKKNPEQWIWFHNRWNN